MGKIMCPGQDTSFWRPGDIFEVECAGCGKIVEFFKDDGQRRCRNCGEILANPKLNLGCAQWCEHAKECLGYDPKEVVEQAQGSGQTSLMDRLIQAMMAEFGDDEKRINHALAVLEWSQKIMEKEGGDPKVVLAAAILHDIGIQEAERKHGSNAGRYQEMEGPAIAERIMHGLKMPEEIIEHVSRIVGSHHSARDIDTLEFRILWDSDWLVNIADIWKHKTPQQKAAMIEKIFKTPTGMELALAEYGPAA